MDNVGRPPYTDTDFQGWLDEMTPYLKQGHSLHYAIFHSGLQKHDWSIRAKYKLDDWFARKIDNFQAYIGEMLNHVFYNELMEVVEAQKQGRPLTDNQWKNMRFLAERHKSSGKYFVSRQEVAIVKQDADTIERLLAELEKENLDETEKAAKEQVEAMDKFENIDDTAEWLRNEADRGHDQVAEGAQKELEQSLQTTSQL